MRLARQWASGGRPDAEAEMTLWEFDLGFVAWRTPPPRPPGDTGPPAVLGAPRAVIDRQTGELTVWPSLAPQAVAERYRASRRAGPRFPDDVREVLTAAGWSSGRDASHQVNRWLHEVYAADPGARQKLPLFPAAFDALVEFGGLRLAPPGRAGVANAGFRVEVFPHGGRVIADAYAEFAADLGVPVFPFAWYEDGPSDLVVDSRGLVFLLHPTAEYLVAGSVDAAIVALVRGPELRRVDEHGTVPDPGRDAPVPAAPAPVRAEDSPPDGRTQQRVDLRYRVAGADGTVTPATLPRSWYFDLPMRRHRTEAWTELLQRIFYDANVALRRRKPQDGEWYVLDSVDVSPVDGARMLAWDGTRTEESALAHLPWMLAPGGTFWESASRLIVDDAGRYDGMEGEDFSELVLYRALAQGRVDEPAARAFLERLYPGHGADCFGDREQRFANIVEVRPTDEFRRAPGTTPWSSGPPSPQDVSGDRSAPG
jgi:hypothetical protein